MTPARSSARRSAHGPQVPPSGQHAQDENLVANKELFIDPMLGTALAIYIEKDVEDKETISDLIVVSHLRVESPSRRPPKLRLSSCSCSVPLLFFLLNVQCACLLI